MLLSTLQSMGVVRPVEPVPTDMTSMVGIPFEDAGNLQLNINKNRSPTATKIYYEMNRHIMM